MAVILIEHKNITMSKKKIYLKAYFRKNLGDDMFVRCIAQRYTNISFKICANSRYAETFESLHNIRNVSRGIRAVGRFFQKGNAKQFWQKCLEKSAHATVHIGGSIFIEPDKFVAPHIYPSNSNLYIIGCNFGPYKTDAYHEFVLSRLQSAIDVCFRDEYSYAEFSSLDHVRVAPDVLFGYREYPEQQRGCGIGISVINLAERQQLFHMADIYYSAIAQTIDICESQNIPVKLFSFCTDEGDQRAINEILDRSKTRKAEICTYDGNIDLILNQINSCEYIIATRFHAMVIGWCLSKKVFPVVYSDKQLHVMHDCGYVGQYWDLRKGETYSAKMLLMDALNTVKMKNIDIYKKESEAQFEKLDDFLENL